MRIFKNIVNILIIKNDIRENGTLKFCFHKIFELASEMRFIKRAA